MKTNAKTDCILQNMAPQPKPWRFPRKTAASAHWFEDSPFWALIYRPIIADIYRQFLRCRWLGRPSTDFSMLLSRRPAELLCCSIPFYGRNRQILNKFAAFLQNSIKRYAIVLWLTLFGRQQFMRARKWMIFKVSWFNWIINGHFSIINHSLSWLYLATCNRISSSWTIL